MKLYRLPIVLILFLSGLACLAATNASQAYLFKRGKITLANAALKSFPFETAPTCPRLEIQRLSPQYASNIQLITNEEIGDTIPIAVWNDETQSFGERQTLPLQKVPTGYSMDLTDLGPWRRIALEFPSQESLHLDDVQIALRDFAEENWHAWWIYCTTDRVEHVTLFMRKEFQLDALPTQAWLQCRFDDGGEAWLNGHRVSSDAEVARHLRLGENVFAVRLVQARYAGGFLAELDLLFDDGSQRQVVTDRSWRFYPSLKEICRQSENLAPPPQLPEAWKLSGYDVSGWTPCVEIDRPPMGVWGRVSYTRFMPRHPFRLETPLAPQKLEAGKAYAQEIHLRFPEPTTDERVAQMRLSRRGIEFQRWTLGIVPDGATDVTLTFHFSLSEFLAAGDYELRLVVPEYAAANGQDTMSVTVGNGRAVAPADAHLQRDKHGVPTLTINGKAYPSLFSARFDIVTLTQHAQQFHAAGLHLYHAYLIPSWPQPDTADYTNVDALAETLLRGDPEARFVLKIELRDARPDWYLNLHPEEAVAFDDGARVSRISLASKRWRNLVGTYLRGLVAHVATSPYADRVIGYFPCEGEEGQWMHYWNGDDPKIPGTLSDYSAPMQAYFREWLGRKYQTDAALQAAWAAPHATLTTATIPTNSERTAGEGAFRLLPRDQKAADFGWALSDVISECLDYYAQVIKEASNGRALVGALYGHLLDLGCHYLGEQVGYARQHSVVVSPYIDYFLGPISYAACFRDVGGTGSYDMPSPATLALHNKIWLNENDLRTHLQFPAEYAFSVRTPAQTSQLLAREFARALCLQSGYYLYALGTDVNWYDDPETMAALRQLRILGEQTIGDNRASTSQIAVFFDDEAQCRLTQTPVVNRPTVNQKAIYQREALFRIGAPVDEYLQFDAANPQLPKYKFYIFLNPYHIKDEELAAIRRIALQPDARLLFAFTPGLAGDHGLTTAVAEALTGMRFTVDTAGRQAAFVTARAFGRLPKGHRFGSAAFHLAPIALPDGYDELLATFADGAPAIVRKGNIYVSALAQIPVELLREIARDAGVFLYSEDNLAVVACHDFAAFHTPRTVQQCRFRAPDGKRLLQIWPDAPDAEAVRELRFKNIAPETRIFRIVDDN